MLLVSSRLRDSCEEIVVRGLIAGPGECSRVLIKLAIIGTEADGRPRMHYSLWNKTISTLMKINAARCSVSVVDSISALRGSPFRARTPLGRMTFPDYVAFQPILPIYERRTKSIVDALRGGLFLDVGTEAGYFSRLAAIHGNRVIAVEPSPRSIRYLKENLRGFDAEIHEVAAWSQRTTIGFTLHGYNRAEPKGEISIRADTLDSILKDRIPDLVKIDAEFSEVEVLKGLAVKPRMIIFECLDRERLSACRELLSDYRITLLDTPAYNYLAQFSGPDSA